MVFMSQKHLKILMLANRGGIQTKREIGPEGEEKTYLLNRGI